MSRKQHQEIDVLVQVTGRLDVYHHQVVAPPPPPPSRPAVKGRLFLNGKEWTMAQQIPDNKPVHFTVAWLDADGNPSLSVDSVDYAVTPATLGTISPDSVPTAGGTFNPMGTPGGLGTGTITATAHTAGSPDVVVSGDIEVVNSVATSGTLTFDNATPPVVAPKP